MRYPPAGGVIDGLGGCLPQSWWLLTPSCEQSALSREENVHVMLLPRCSEFVLGVKIVFPKKGNAMLHLMSEVSIKSTHSSDLL